MSETFNFLNYFMIIKQRAHQVVESVSLSSLLSSLDPADIHLVLSLVYKLEGLRDGQDTGLLCMCFIGFQM